MKPKLCDCVEECFKHRKEIKCCSCNIECDWEENKQLWYCDICDLHWTTEYELVNNQPERLSEKTYIRNEDGIYPSLEPCVGSDSLTS